MKILSKLAEEISLVALVTTYFLVSFVLVGTIKMLFLAEYDIEFAGVAKAVVGALVTGKVVVVLDKTTFGDRFRTHAVGLDVLYKAFVYTSCVALVLALEKVVHELGEADGFADAARLAWENVDAHRFTATALCLYMVFVGYALLTVLADHFGKDRLRSFLFDANARRASRESLSEMHDS